MRMEEKNSSVGQKYNDSLSTLNWPFEITVVERTLRKIYTCRLCMCICTMHGAPLHYCAKDKGVTISLPDPAQWSKISVRGRKKYYYCFVRFSFLIDIEAFYSFYIVSETPILRNFHVDVEFFYSFLLKNLYCCRFDVIFLFQIWCRGFLFRIYVSKVSSRCQT